jgi:hypothetical protein
MCVQSTLGTSCLLDPQPLTSKRECLAHCDVSRTYEGLSFNQIIQVSYVLSSTRRTQNNLKAIMKYRLGRMLKELPVSCYTELYFAWGGTIKKTCGYLASGSMVELEISKQRRSRSANGWKGGREGKGLDCHVQSVDKFPLSWEVTHLKSLLWHTR